MTGRTGNSSIGEMRLKRSMEPALSHKKLRSYIDDDMLVRVENA
jgi:hypothetical protein